MSISFETPRLRVFVMNEQPTPHNTPCLIFIAFRTDEDRPLVCATAVVNTGYENLLRGCYYVDWIEVTSQYRRQGFGRELVQAIRKYTKKTIISTGATPEGEAFCKELWL